jgi:hypothetical protein
LSNKGPVFRFIHGSSFRSLASSSASVRYFASASLARLLSFSNESQLGSFPHQPSRAPHSLFTLSSYIHTQSLAQFASFAFLFRVPLFFAEIVDFEVVADLLPQPLPLTRRLLPVSCLTHFSSQNSFSFAFCLRSLVAFFSHLARRSLQFDLTAKRSAQNELFVTCLAFHNQHRPLPGLFLASVERSFQMLTLMIAMMTLVERQQQIIKDDFD